MGKIRYLSNKIKFSVTELLRMYNYVCPSNSLLLDSDVSLFVMSLQSSIVAELLIKKMSLKYLGKYKKVHEPLDLLDTFISDVHGKIPESTYNKIHLLRKKNLTCLSVDHSKLRYESVKVVLPSEESWDRLFIDLYYLLKELGVK